MGVYVRIWEELTGERNVSIKGYTDSISLENAVKSNTNVQNRRLRIDMCGEGIVTEIVDQW